MHFTPTLDRFVVTTGHYWEQRANAANSEAIEERRAQIAREHAVRVFCRQPQLPPLNASNLGQYKLALCFAPDTLAAGLALGALLAADRLRAVEFAGQCGVTVGNVEDLVACARAMVEAERMPTFGLRVSVAHLTLHLIDLQRGSQSRAFFASQAIECDPSAAIGSKPRGSRDRLQVALTADTLAALNTRGKAATVAGQLLDNLQH